MRRGVILADETPDGLLEKTGTTSAEAAFFVLLLVVPSLLIGLMARLFSNTPVFNWVGPAMLALFPFIIMFLITSISTLRDRRSGTLEKLLALADAVSAAGSPPAGQPVVQSSEELRHLHAGPDRIEEGAE
ncbi:hypothetical protein [Frigoribacterium sp. CG_9.8]|uniref:hypothetical protein n=1 Tax=Frigoribacterium sp. CG_9.8 TaxID=2787733 RepID=UPI001A1E4FF4|nr:hypothetical protein [Frigoribacterium sp. CG_9.8]